MATVDELCDRAAFIVDGKVSLIEDTQTLKRRYGSPTLRVEYLVDGKPSVAEFPLTGLGANAGFQRVAGASRDPDSALARGHARERFHQGHRTGTDLSRLISRGIWDCRLQFRNGFYYAAVAVAVMLIGLLRGCRRNKPFGYCPSRCWATW